MKDELTELLDEFNRLMEKRGKEAILSLIGEPNDYEKYTDKMRKIYPGLRRLLQAHINWIDDDGIAG